MTVKEAAAGFWRYADVVRRAAASLGAPDAVRSPLEVRRSLVHLAIPTAASMLLIAAFFSGVPWLTEAVAPRVNREFGILEHLQIGVLLAAVVIAARGASRKPTRLERAAFALLLAGTVFVVLEEIDYGLHYYEALAGVPPEQRAQLRNVHNVGENTDRMKFAADLGMALLFVVLPLAARRSRSAILHYVTPSPWYAATLLVSILAGAFAHALRDAGLGPSGVLTGNLSEFRELLIYYIFALYLYEVASSRTMPRLAQRGAHRASVLAAGGRSSAEQSAGD